MATESLGELLIGLGLDVDAQSFQKAGTSIRDLENQSKDLGITLRGVFGKAGVVGAAVGAVGGMGAAAVSAAGNITELERAASRLGTTSGGIQSLGNLFGVYGGSASDALGAMQRLQEMREKVFRGEDVNSDMSRAMGVDLNQIYASSNTVPDLYDQLRSSTSGMNAGQRNQLLESAGISETGRNIINDSQARASERYADAQERIAKISPDLAADSERLYEQWTELQQTLGAMGDVLQNSLVPGFADMLNGTNEFLTKWLGWMNSNQDRLSSTASTITEVPTWSKVKGYASQSVDDFKRMLGFNSNSASSDSLTPEAIASARMVAFGNPLFDALLQQESGGRHRNADGSLVTSSAGALGIAQTMPGTLRDPGYGVVPARNNSESENRRVGFEYLASMIGDSDGNIEEGLARYNAGPGRIDKLKRRYGSDWLNYAPDETQDYVSSIGNRMASRGINIDGLTINVSGANGDPYDIARIVQQELMRTTDEAVNDSQSGVY